MKGNLLLLSICLAAFGCDPISTTADNSQPAITASNTQRVLLISIDGFHQFDLDAYVQAHPTSALAALVGRGTRYTGTTSSRPTDSFPGTLAMTTGGSPASTGIFYDVSWDDRLSPPGSNCSTRGTAVIYDGQANIDDTVVDAVIDPNKLPRDPDNGCAPVYPHSYLRVNTIFEVTKAAGLRTAVTDKHPTYELLHGPSGAGVDDLFTPENDANGAKKSIAVMEAYDETKVQAVINWIDGFDHARMAGTGVPAIMMMNFQAANIGEKIGGYADATGTPTAALAGAFDYIDGALGRMLAELDAQGLTSSTLVIVTAKHGDSPVDLSARRAIDPALIDATVNGVQPGLLAQETPDTVSLIWLKDHRRTDAVAAALRANAAALGIGTLYVGEQIEHIFGGTFDAGRARRPDLIIDPVYGVIYTTSSATFKKVEHGGFNEEASHVPLVLAGPGVCRGAVTAPVDLRQVAPTILAALGLDPAALQAVVLEHTQRLPAIDGCTVGG